MQAIQLVWRPVKQLLSDDNELVAGCALSLIPNEAITSAVLACAQLPLGAFSTPKTRTGVLCCATCVTHNPASSCAAYEPPVRGES